jgi:hypothetical protein
MGKRQSAKIGKYIMLVSVTAFLLSVQAFGTNQGTSERKNHPASQSRQTSRGAQVPSRPVTGGPSSFRPDMSFAQAIDILRHSTSPPLNIAVLWKDLEENADIYRDTPIGIDGLSKVSLRMHLKFLLMGVSGGSPVKLGYIVDDGVIIIGTRESLPVKMKARVYDVTDLVAPPANYFFFPSPGMPFGVPFGGFGGFGTGGGYGMGFQGGAAGMTPGGSYGYGSGLMNLMQNQYGSPGSSYGNYSTRPTR